MQSPIDNAIQELFMRIPPQILALAFIGPHAINNPYIQNNANIPSAIRERVVNRRVLKDFNLLGGTEHVVPLYGLEPQIIDHYARVYYVPKDRTQGRSIIDVLSMSYGTMGTYGYNLGLGMTSYANNGEYGRGALQDGLMNIQASYSAIPQVGTANCRLIGENMVYISDIIPISMDPHLRCRLAYDNELSTMSASFQPFMAELVYLATRAFIYNELVVQLDLAALIGGQELGVVTDIIRGYEDSDRMYIELRDEKMAKKAYLADPVRKQRHIKLVMGGSN